MSQTKPVGNMALVSVILPTYNRFRYLQNTINSVLSQTYKNIEIIVVDDCSSDEEYTLFDWKSQPLTYIRLEQRSKDVVGNVSSGYVRNQGIEVSRGAYIAFCDDDDIWFPEKIEAQLNALDASQCKLCCTGAYVGTGVYDQTTRYPEKHKIKVIKKAFRRTEYSSLFKRNLPKIWTLDMIRRRNIIVCSSVLVDKNLLLAVGLMPHCKWAEDYLCWKRLMAHTNCYFLQKPLVYYDLGHGLGSNH
jgi:glycosyltransferase involved in cell wall biosynthesis